MTRDKDRETYGKLHREYLEFRADNPKVFNDLKRMALELRRRGRDRYGMKALFEVLRYQRAIDTDTEPFKLNNNFTAFFARDILREPDCGSLLNCRVNKNGELRDFFEMRKQFSRGTQRHDPDLPLHLA